MRNEVTTKRTLRVTKNQIEVSANHYAEEGMIASHEASGVLPGCRVVATLSTMPCTERIIVSNLYSHSGCACIRPVDWAALIEAAEIVSDRHFPVELTPEIRTWARQQALGQVHCPAVTSLKDVHPNFLKELRSGKLYDKLSFPASDEHGLAEADRAEASKLAIKQLETLGLLTEK